jgi:hypothetical protein
MNNSVFTSRRLVALHTLARWMYGRYPTHCELTQLFFRMVRT